MKYNQFLQLSEILDKSDQLFEAPTTEIGQLDTKKGNIFTRWGLMKNKLNKTARKVQDQVINKVVQKYLPTILETEVNAAKQVVELMQQQKQPREIMQILQKNLGTIAHVQQKQIKTINETIDQFVQSSASKMNAKIDASKMSDKNKLNIKNYWLLLTTQIKMNALQHISEKIQEAVRNVLGNNENALRYQRAASPNLQIINSTVDTINKDLEQKKFTVTTAEEEMKNQKPTLTSEPGKLPEIGKRYIYITTKGEQQNVTVANITDDGIVVQPDSGTSYSVKKDRIDKFIPVKSEGKRDINL